MELEPKFGQIIHKTKSIYYNTATPRLLWNKRQNLVKLYTRQSQRTATLLHQGSSGTRAKIWSNYTQDKVYMLQHSYSKAAVEQDPKIWSNYTQDKVYILQHTYSKAPVKQEPKFFQIIHKTKSIYCNTATQRLQWNKSQNLVKLYTRQSLHTTTQLLQSSSGTKAKFFQIIHKTKSIYCNTATQRLQWNKSQNLVKLYTRQSQHTATQLLQGCSGTRAKIWSNYTQDKVYILQHSYSKAAVEQEPKFGQIIHKTKSTYYNTATPRLQWNKSQNFFKIIHKTKSIYYNTATPKAPVEQEPKFGQIIHKTKSAYYNTATPRLQWN